MLVALKPFGVWGIGALAVIDSAAIPVPIDALLIDYVIHDKPRFLIYCFMGRRGRLSVACCPSTWVAQAANFS